METDAYLIMGTHWQSLYSNGSRVGLRALEEIAKRVNLLLADRVQWMSFEEIMIMKLTLE